VGRLGLAEKDRRTIAAKGPVMSRALRDRARRHGTVSISAGSEPPNRELTAHWPEKKRRKAKIIKHADASTYQIRGR
jgi:hypothetical protein